MLGKKRPDRENREAAGGRNQREKDYRSYALTKVDAGRCLAWSAALSCLIAFLFYESALGCMTVALLFPASLIRRRHIGCQEQQRGLKLQFKECIRVLTSSLYAGYSVENAFRAAQAELEQLLGEKADMCRELRQINGQLRLNVPVESLIENLAWRSGVEEIFTFGQVFAYAKHNGSNFTRILQDASERIGDKLELEREIQTMIASKQLEQRIMNLIPMGILLFVRITNPGFLDVMYTTGLGRVAMSVCLVLYGGAFLLAERIVDIKV